MSKFLHKFVLSESDIHKRIYVCDDITARLDFIDESCLRVAIFKNDENILPTFSVCPNNSMPVCGRDRLDTSGFSLSSPKVISVSGIEKITLGCGIEIELQTENFILKYLNGDKLLFSDREPLAYNFENEFGRGSFHYVSREINEHIYGLGDKGGNLDKNGRSFRIETTDCMGYDASSSDPLYKHVSFYICENSAGSYGIFYDTCDTSYVDFGKEINNYYEPYKYFRTDDNALIYYVFFGTKLEILKKFSRLCGKQAFPPKWSLDYCASTMSYTDAPDSGEKMNGFLEKLRELNLGCSGFYLSSGYTSIGERRYVFNWNCDKFPDPKKFIRTFKENGIEIIPNIKPAFLSDHPMYAYIKEKGWFLKNPDSSPFVTRFWDGLGSYLDFTNPGAFNFWKEQVDEKLLDNGISATWNDNNEFDIKDSDALAFGFGGGEINANRLRPALTYLMVRASFEAQREKYPAIRPFLSTRSGGIAVRRMAQTWSGDNRSEFSDLRYCHKIGLTLSLSGMYFYGHDLGGFSGAMPSRELLMRWLQHGLFEPRFTIHSWNSDGSATMPWSYPDIFDSVKAIFAQRKRLIPYLYNCAYNAVEKDEPINAPLVLYYDDEKLDVESDSFLVGRDILAAFVFDKGEEKTSVYLPRGDDWYLGNRLYRGGETVELTIRAEDEMPYFVRSGSVIPTDEALAGFKRDEELIFTVFPLEKGEFESEFFTDDGVSYKYLTGDCVKIKFSVVCTEDSVSVFYENMGKKKRNPKVRLGGGDRRRIEIAEK